MEETVYSLLGKIETECCLAKFEGGLMSEKLGSILISGAHIGNIEVSNSLDGRYIYADQVGYDYQNGLDITIDSFDKAIYDMSRKSEIFGITTDIEINFYPASKYKTLHFHDRWIKSEDPRISKITKVIVNGPATIIIDHRGNKTVVKCQDEFKNYDPLFGFYLCLLRYILDKKKYHDTMMDIFEYDEDFVNRKMIVRTILYSHIGQNETDKITEKFVQDNGLYSPSKLYKKIGDASVKEMKKQYKKYQKQFKKNFETKYRG